MLSKLFAFGFIAIFFACTAHHPKQVEEQVAKMYYQDEIRDLLDRYKKESDTLKLQTAYYLLQNMDNKHSYESPLLEKYREVFPKIAAIDDYDTIHAIWDKVENLYGTPTIDRLNISYDRDVLDATLLNDNIEWALKAWQESPWHQKVKFATFLNAVAPYRCSDEPLENWRELLYNNYRWLLDSISDTTTEINLCMQLNEHLFGWIQHNDAFNKYPIGIKPSVFRELQTGDCKHKDNYTINTMRALGLPVVLHYTPFWADRNEGHNWCALLQPTGEYFAFLGGEITPFSSHAEVPLPYKAPKIWQINYHMVNQNLWEQAQNNKNIPPWLSNPYYSDVTSAYPPVSDISIPQLKTFSQEQLMYLAVFNQPYWKPVFWGQQKNDSVTFKNMKRDIVYLPIYIEENGFVPAGNPIILHQDGRIKTLETDNTKIDMHLTRKYPLVSSIKKYENYIVGGRIEAANKSDFSDAVILTTVKKYVDGYYSFTYNLPKKYRYIRYCCTDSTAGNVAELEVFSHQNNKEIQLSGNPMVFTQETYPDRVNIVFDEDYLSFFDTKYQKDLWFGLDLQSAQNITKVKVWPRSDLNFIVEGNTYELFYWDNKWMSAGEKIAEKPFLEYKNIPSGTLYWLRNLSSGVEERIFTYENGKQIWW